MAEYICEVCGRGFNEEEKELTNDEKNCILHCDKSEENNWYKVSFLKKEWDNKKVNKFWKVIQDELDHLYENSFYDNVDEYNLKNIVFPKFQIESEYNKYEDNLIDLGTSFYSYGVFERPNEQPYPEINKIFENLYITFENCIFEDDADFQKYKFRNELKFKNCIFKSRILLPESLSVSFKETKFLDGIVVSNLLPIFLPEIRSVFNQCEFYNRCTFNENVIIEPNLFRNCLFHEGIFGRNVLFKKKLFNHGWNFMSTEYGKKGFYNIKHIHLTESIFEDDFIVNDDLDVNLEYSNFKFILDTLHLHRSTFKKSFKIINSEIQFPYLINVKFEGLVDLTNSVLGVKNSKSSFDHIIFSFIEFRGIVKFNNVDFLTKVNLNGAIFFDSVSFINSNFYQPLNLENVIFKNDGNFLHIEAELENRETARIIKSALDKNDNIIESNKYYKIEMEKQEKELERDIKLNFTEWIIFKIHRLSSNHSQSWIRALGWIFFIPFIIVLFGTIDNINSLVYNIHIKGFWNEIVNLINPFSIMIKGETLTFGMFLFKVIIAYLIYQFIVSIRQNTRRK